MFTVVKIIARVTFADESIRLQNQMDMTEEVTCTERAQRTFQSETIPTGSKQNVLIFLSQCQSERVQG